MFDFDEYTDPNCCPPEVAECFKNICNDDYLPTDTGRATLLIFGNLTPPKIGDLAFNMSLEDGVSLPQDITADNYFPATLIWKKRMQYLCGDGEFDSEVVWFPEGTAILKEANRTVTYNESSYDFGKPKANGSTLELELDIKHALANCQKMNEWGKSGKKLQIIAFTDKTFKSYTTANKANISVTDATIPLLAATRKTVSGGMLKASVNSQELNICHSQIPKSWLSKWDEMRTKQTEFTFSRAGIINPFTQTGLTAQLCGIKSKCLNYETKEKTAFDWEWKPLEASTCGSYTIYQNCDQPVTASGILIDGETGKVTSTGLPANSYQFRVVYQNECCVYGEYCIQLTVKP